MSKQYNLENLRILLTEGFTREELYQFCFEETAFQPFYHQIPPNTSQTELARLIVDYAARRSLLDNLLAWAKDNNPAQYEKHQPYLETPPLAANFNKRSPKYRWLVWLWQQFVWLVMAVGLLVLLVLSLLWQGDLNQSGWLSSGSVKSVLECNQPDLAETPETLKIVIADFKEETNSANDLNTEDRLYESLQGQLPTGVVICRSSQIIASSREARQQGQTLNAAVVIWGRQDPVLFEVGIEVADWDLSRLMVQVPPAEARSTKFQAKTLPALTSLITGLSLSQIYFLNNQIESARATLTDTLAQVSLNKEFTENNPDELAKAYFLLGFFFDPVSTKPDCRYALQAYQHAFELDRTLLAALLNQGAAYECLGQIDKALETYTYLIDKKTRLAAPALVDRANLKLESNYEEAAEADLKAAIALEPDFPYNYHFLGVAQLRAGKTSEAKQTYQACLPFLDQSARDDIFYDLTFLAEEKPEAAGTINEIIEMLKKDVAP